MKSVVITGANRGIGYFLVKQLLEQGDQAAVLDLETDALSDLQTHYPDALLPIRCDVSDPGAVQLAVEASVEKFGAVTHAIHNACFCPFVPFAETDNGTIERVMAVNYFGAVNLTRAVLLAMKGQGGKIFYTSSGVGVTGFAAISAYASSKGALESLAKCLNLEFLGTGVTFHLFHPPLTKTASSAGLPVPAQFMADAETVGRGLARRLDQKSFVICHSFAQALQISLSYWFPIGIGRQMTKMTNRVKNAGG